MNAREPSSPSSCVAEPSGSVERLAEPVHRRAPSRAAGDARRPPRTRRSSITPLIVLIADARPRPRRLGRAARDDVDDAEERVGAVQRRHRAADHLDARDRRRSPTSASKPSPANAPHASLTRRAVDQHEHPRVEVARDLQPADADRVRQPIVDEVHAGDARRPPRRPCGSRTAACRSPLITVTADATLPRLCSRFAAPTTTSSSAADAASTVAELDGSSSAVGSGGRSATSTAGAAGGTDGAGWPAASAAAAAARTSASAAARDLMPRPDPRPRRRDGRRIELAQHERDVVLGDRRPRRSARPPARTRSRSATSAAPSAAAAPVSALRSRRSPNSLPAGFARSTTPSVKHTNRSPGRSCSEPRRISTAMLRSPSGLPLAAMMLASLEHARRAELDHVREVLARRSRSAGRRSPSRTPRRTPSSARCARRPGGSPSRSRAAPAPASAAARRSPTAPRPRRAPWPRSSPSGCRGRSRRRRRAASGRSTACDTSTSRRRSSTPACSSRRP